MSHGSALWFSKVETRDSGWRVSLVSLPIDLLLRLFCKWSIQPNGKVPSPGACLLGFIRHCDESAGQPARARATFLSSV